MWAAKRDLPTGQSAVFVTLLPESRLDSRAGFTRRNEATKRRRKDGSRRERRERREVCAGTDAGAVRQPLDCLRRLRDFQLAESPRSRVLLDSREDAKNAKESAPCTILKSRSSGGFVPLRRQGPSRGLELQRKSARAMSDRGLASRGSFARSRSISRFASTFSSGARASALPANRRNCRTKPAVCIHVSW